MLADIDFAQLNTWILAGVGLITAGGVIFTGFNSKAVREANGLLKTEMEASNARADRLEKERDDYREKLHDAQTAMHSAQLENEVLKVKTDFTPVMQFQEKWYAEQGEVSKQTLTMLRGMSELLAKLNDKLEVAHAPK